MTDDAEWSKFLADEKRDAAELRRAEASADRARVALYADRSQCDRCGAMVRKLHNHAGRALVCGTCADDLAEDEKGPPPEFQVDPMGALVCIHRDVSCCDACAAEHEQIVSIGAVYYWIDDPDEREEMRDK